MSQPDHEEVDIASVALALQTALLGEVPAHLRGVSFELLALNVSLTFYFAQPPSPQDMESTSVVETELLASLPETYSTSVSLIFVPPEVRLPMQNRWAYRRREP